MKKIKSVIVLIFCVLLLSACSNSLESEIWSKFSKALSLTSALNSYYIEKTVEIDGDISKNEIMLTQNDDNEYVAYKKISDGTEQYYYQGNYYYEQGGQKIKKAIILDEFLEVSSTEKSFKIGDVQNIKEKKGYIIFMLTGEYSGYSVKAKVGKTFLQELSVSATVNGVSKIITYKYINAGRRPAVTLPVLADYNY